jgi:hypothetical protein
MDKFVQPFDLMMLFRIQLIYYVVWAIAIARNLVVSCSVPNVSPMTVWNRVEIKFFSTLDN